MQNGKPNNERWVQIFMAAGVGLNTAKQMLELAANIQRNPQQATAAWQQWIAANPLYGALIGGIATAVASWWAGRSIGDAVTEE
jgi:hypothetical protein